MKTIIIGFFAMAIASFAFAGNGPVKSSKKSAGLTCTKMMCNGKCTKDCPKGCNPATCNKM